MQCLVIAGIGLVSIAGFAAVANAADLPARTYKSPPPVVARY